MAKQRYINTKFWSDPWVVDNLNPLDRYLFLYLLSNEKTNIAGVYEISLRTMSFETGIETDTLKSMLQRLDPKVHYEDGWVVVARAVAHQNFRNSKVLAGIKDVLSACPADLLQYVDLPSELIHLYDRSSMTNQGTLHSDIDIDYNSDNDNNSYAPTVQPTAEPVYEPVDDFATKPLKAVAQSGFGNKETNGIMALAKKYGFTNGKLDRYAAARLIKQRDYKMVRELLEYSQTVRGTQFAPQITSLPDLERKWLKLSDYKDARSLTVAELAKINDKVDAVKDDDWTPEQVEQYRTDQIAKAVEAKSND